MATFTWTPTYIVNKSIMPRIRITEFGDGYTQRAGDGLNTQRQEWSLEFISDSTTTNAIEAFLIETGGVDSFTWTLPGQSTPLKFRYMEYEKSPAGPFAYLITTTFRQEFDL